jgi:hypothetical protein
MQDLVGGDYNRTPVVFRDLDNYNIVGAMRILTLRLSGSTPSVGVGCSLIGAIRLFPLPEFNNKPIRISYLSTE